MNKINRLDPQTISQIAAGEIIENPASVCKELIENSIDAQAKNIFIDIAHDPSQAIRITDDGSGIKADDIPLAFERYATSKLQVFSDLKDLYTLGFRGEALASIANISKVTLVTRTQDQDLGHKALIREGKLAHLEVIGSPKGTSILVEDLFYNVPVRKKYLKSIQREVQVITDLVEKIALSHPDIAFHLTREGKTLLQSKANTPAKNHIYSLLGREIAENLIPISFETESYKIQGYISNNKLHRSTSDREYLFVNGRFVRSREIARKIRSLYHTLIPLNRYPVFILYLDIDPILVDVNIHPQKQEVKLSEENYLLLILERLIRSALIPNREIPSIKSQDLGQKEAKKPVLEEKISIFDLAKKEEEKKEAEEAFLKEALKEEPPAPKEPSYPLEEDPLEVGYVLEDIPSYDRVLKLDKEAHGKRSLELKLEEIDYLNACFDTFLLFEEREKKNLLVVDQHAAHERIRFEKLYRTLKEETPHSQVLLRPLSLDLSFSDQEKLKSLMPLFEDLGFKLETFGRDHMVIREVPSSPLIKSPQQFIQDALLEIEDKPDIIEKNIYDIMRMACRSAIKSGDRLSEEEAFQLLRDLENCEIPYTCPHGRPTLIRISKREFEKMFLREG
ncbi:MAG: DNA mismatch repair endonuclease MutL [Tissierellia bacterium]|nr:DNA mismatch repair endonuclease MutL [Tissierellia bacterium]